MQRLSTAGTRGARARLASGSPRLGEQSEGARGLAGLPEEDARGDRAVGVLAVR